ncbi:MAG TPA: type II secretion system protein [Anaerohalosphaeraceae bacterium]|nr:type II secretion system protein [Anaerohalosphaeraceae bacterium]
MTRKKGFTLIELLVVIAIISLLLSIIVPAVKMAKRKAATAVCLTNVKNLTLAWYSYQGENDGRFMAASPTASDAQAPWVRHPIREDGTPCLPTSTNPPVTDDDEKRGIAKGKMYEYGVDNFDTYHCPGDTYRKSKYDGTTIFRSYAIPSALGSGITRFHQITSPATRYNFVEEGEGRNFNFGAWEFYTPWDSFNEFREWYWRDPISINHGNSGIIGFCDGHAEIHVWQDSDTKARLDFYFSNPSITDYGFGGNALNTAFAPFRTPGQNNDTQYMGRGWAIQSPTRK